MTDQLHTRSLRFDTVEQDGDGRTIEGYCSVWDDPIIVNDWDGQYREQFAKGSFLRTLRERGPAKVKMQYDHGYDIVGSLPIGVWEEIREDSHGLYVRGRLLDSWLVAPVQAAIEAGAVDGMSIRFRAVAQNRDESGELPFITHTEVKLLEAGPVCWPAFESTEVGVRSTSDAVLTLFRAIMRGEVPDLVAARQSRSAPNVTPDPLEDTAKPVQQLLVSGAERRRRALELRGMANDPPGEAASAAR